MKAALQRGAALPGWPAMRLRCVDRLCNLLLRVALGV